MTKAERKQAAKFRKWKKAVDKQAAQDVATVRAALDKAKNSDWLLCQKKDLTREERKQRSVTRVAKAAVRVLYPQYKVGARYGRGTARGWLHVNIEVPELEGMHKLYESNRKAYDVARGREQLMTFRVDEMLSILGIPLGHYWPDIGPGACQSPCLSVHVNSSGF